MVLNILFVVWHPPSQLDHFVLLFLLLVLCSDKFDNVSQIYDDEPNSQKVYYAIQAIPNPSDVCESVKSTVVTMGHCLLRQIERKRDQLVELGRESFPFLWLGDFRC